MGCDRKSISEHPTRAHRETNQGNAQRGDPGKHPGLREVADSPLLGFYLAILDA